MQRNQNGGVKIAGYTVIRSKVLEEDIILIEDKSLVKEARENHPGLVLYFPVEVDRLKRATGGEREVVRKLHMAKKAFNGWLVGDK